jgi:DNA-binding MarR family transcriptional regulator
MNSDDLDAAGVWAKRYFLASRAVAEAALRPYDLGNTQYYVLTRLAADGPLPQREITRELDVERATLSAVIGALVRKRLIEQTADQRDQRQKLLSITAAGRALWESIDDPIGVIASVAFAGVDRSEIATMNRVLEKATRRLTDYRKTADKKGTASA